ncbi:type VII secretion target [Catellatospora aurea]|uniref:Type VII secretion target n=1 Tax=Catellatospora aurea TaxID=1337874 RepID=A0ABW2GR58_9ACTN
MRPDDGGPPLRALPDQIRDHGRTIDHLVERVAETRAAAARVGYDSGSYGLLNGWLPRLIDDLVDRAVECVDQTSRTMDTIADGLRTVADTYAAGDAAADTTVRGVR